MKIITCDGNEACSRSSYLFTEVAGIYPITPASPIAEHVDQFSSNGFLNIFGDRVKVVEMQSEAGAAGMVHGSLQAGALTATYTASQGLLLMIPNMYKMAGEMLPCVIHVAARSLSTHALSIFGDHQDVYATRMTGFTIISSSNVQEAADLAGLSHLVAIESSLPILHFYDGFRTSHEISKISILEKEDYMDIFPFSKVNEFKMKALNPINPVTRGTAENDDIYFQATEVRNKFYDVVPDIVNDYMEKINKKTNKNYKPFVYYGASDADRVIVAMGSVCDTIMETIDDLNNKGYKVGLIKVHLYRPFSSKYLLNVLPKTVKNIAVLDRTKEFGSVGEPLYLDISNTLKDINVYGGRYGLSSKDTKPCDIKAVYDFLNSCNKFNSFTIGINDDVTNLSLDVDSDYYVDTNSVNYKIFGYGSDGMVSASKSLIKLIGDKTSKKVQGYFQYDSKKSGGVTVGHLRFSEELIKSSYYVNNPSLVLCSKENYLDKYDVLEGILDNGTFLLVTDKYSDINEIPNKIKKVILDKNINFYVIDAYELAKKIGLGNKISMIMEMAIIEVSNIVDKRIAKDYIINFIEKTFAKKGKEVIDLNIKALDMVNLYLKKIDNNNLFVEESNEIEDDKNFFEMINSRKGNLLPVSAFLDKADGTFESEMSKKEKRAISDMVPMWIPENCIECNQCSFVCPHGVIRPFMLNSKDVEKMPFDVKTKDSIIKKYNDYKFNISTSINDCTGCMQCVNSCPGLNGKKALVMVNLSEMLEKGEDKKSEYIFENVKDKELFKDSTVKGSQFKKPKFEFSGACKGCGETPYIKNLTQLFGDRMIIANATGCSSIYGGSAPSTPYSIPWASSLFEDNAEYGYGILIANNTIRNNLYKLIKSNLDSVDKDTFALLNKWIDNINNYDITYEVYKKLDYDNNSFLKNYKDYIPYRSIWTIGGDGWAYDIGYGGVDHVLASNDNVNILVLNSEVYSNTGGQSSKASSIGSLAKFTASGKKTNKKNLAKIALSYKNCYVASCSIGYNKQQYLKALKEAYNHDGPSIIICYTPCIAHGIKGGLENSIEEEKMATKCGYFPIFRYNPEDNKFTLDSKDVDFDLYDSFLMNENRFKMLNLVNPEKAKSLLLENKNNAIETYNFYKELSEK